MTTQQHTPGPWEADKLDSDGIPIYGGPTDNAPLIARVYDVGEDIRTNARLIAAAPDLLAALQDLLEARRLHMGPSAVRLRYEIARDAIAAATGGQP